jgi:hypothetical protein
MGLLPKLNTLVGTEILFKTHHTIKNLHAMNQSDWFGVSALKPPEPM